MRNSNRDLGPRPSYESPPTPEFSRIRTGEEAIDIARLWLTQPNAVIVEPSDRHHQVFFGLLEETGTAANLVNDCHLAALALDHDMAIATFDADFGRFPGLNVVRPA